MTCFILLTRNDAVVHTASQMAAVPTSCPNLDRFPLWRLHGDTAMQFEHVPSSATASGTMPHAQVLKMQVGTLRVTAWPGPTRRRERVALAVGRGGLYACRL